MKQAKLTVKFDGTKCIHARRCVLGLPQVFKPDTKGGWIFTEHAKAEEIAHVIDRCPSGALTYKYDDGDIGEEIPKVNTARLRENGPLEFLANLHLSDEEPRIRTTLCRCGKSGNKPYCDNSHIKADFIATSEVATTDKTETLNPRDGVLEITPLKNGPLMVVGSLEIIAGSGRKIATGTKQAICRCGASKTKPFCDGSHKEIGFKAD